MNESEMMERIIGAIRDLSPVEFVEEYNRMYNTNLTINDIEWDGWNG